MAVYFASIITSILIARQLGPDGRGQYAVITLWATILATAASLSIGDAVGVAAARADLPSAGPSPIYAIMGRALPTALCAFLLTLVPCLITFHFAVTLSGVKPTLFLYLLVTLSLFSTASNLVFGNYHRAQSRYVSYNLARSIVILLLSVLLISATFASRMKLDLDEVLTLFAVAVCVGTGVTFLLDSSIWTNVSWSKPDLELFKSGLAMHSPILLFMISSQIDRFVAMYAMPTKEFGLFAIAASVAQPPSSLLWTTLKAVIIGDRILQDPQKSKARLRQYAFWIMLTTIAMSPVAATTLYFLVPVVFGSQFAPAASTTSWLILGYALSPLRIMLHEVRRSTNRNAHAIIIETVYIATVLFVFLALSLTQLATGSTIALSLLAGNFGAVVVAISWPGISGARKVFSAVPSLGGIPDAD
jgi:O-antigen/teichoic acid export membrane protein